MRAIAAARVAAGSAGALWIAGVGALDKLLTGTVKAPSGPTNSRAASACGGASSFITS